MRARGRPPSPWRIAIMERAQHGSFTMRDLCAHIPITHNTASVLLTRLQSAGDLTVVGWAQVHGAKRKVALYGKPAPSSAPEALASALSLIVRLG